MVKKALCILCVVCFLGFCVTPVFRGMVLDDVTPPVTVASFDPAQPNENGWYNTAVRVTLTAMDNESGVNATYYQLNQGGWIRYSGPFSLKEGNVTFTYYSVDNAGNAEVWKSSIIHIDTTSPVVVLNKNILLKGVKFTADCRDSLSGINHVDFFIHETCVASLHEPPYETFVLFPLCYPPCHFRGFICAPSVVGDDNISFFVLHGTVDNQSNYYCWVYDNAGNAAGNFPCFGPFSYSFFFKWVVFPNEYTGYLGRHHVNAWFQ